MTLKSKTSKKSKSSTAPSSTPSTSSSPTHSAIDHTTPVDRNATRAQLLASRNQMRAPSPTQMAALSNLNPTHPGQTYANVTLPAPAVTNIQPQQHSVPQQFLTPQNTLLTMTTLDVAASAERLMLSGYHHDLNNSGQGNSNPNSRPNSRPGTPPLGNASDVIGLLGEVVERKLGIGVGVGNPAVFARTEVTPVVKERSQENFFNAEVSGEVSQAPVPIPPSLSGAMTATAPNAAFASSTECLHLTLLLRRTLSELDARGKHLNEANLSKLELHAEVERCKVRLEALMLEGEELRRRTEEAEVKAQGMVDDEYDAINRAESQARAAEKRFEILVDWSRKEESKRLILEDTMRDALEKIETTTREHDQETKSLRADCLSLQQALDTSNASNLQKHKALMTREAAFMDLSKTHVGAEQLATSCQSESLALKNLAGKLEVELEGTKSRLKSVEVSSGNHVSELGEALKMKEREGLQGAREIAHWKKSFENSEHKNSALLNDNEELGRLVKAAEARVVSCMSNEKNNDQRLDMMMRGEEELKRSLWAAEERVRAARDEEDKKDKEIARLLQKNDSLNRMVDGLEEDFRVDNRGAGGGGGSPNLLRYDVNPAF